MREYVMPSKDGSYVYLSASIAGYMEKRVALYEQKNGSVLALRNEKDGQLEVSSTVNGQGVKRVVYSRVLVDCLRPLQSESRGHISAWYDAAMGALLLGDDGMETEFDYQAFRRLDLSRIHRFPCQIAPGYLRIRQTFQNRSEALFKGCHLAFLKRNAGEVVLETEGEEGIIRKPEVVSFAWKHWKDKTLYNRFLERGTVVSPDIRALARLHDLDGFAPLRATASMTAELGRDFCLRFSPAVIDSLGRGLSVYLCGPYLALGSDGEGDIQVREKEGRGLVYAPRLYQQLTMRYPGSSRLFLIPHGNFLVFSETETCESLPPEDYFCRLLVSRERSAHLMRYGAAL